MNARRGGLLVVVLGCHGSGKSTLVAAVADQLRRRDLRVDECYLGRAQDPRLIAPLRPAIESLAHRLVARRARGAEADPTAGSRLHGAAGWWYAVNLAGRFHRHVRPRLRRGGVVVVDRYVDDLAVMPGASRRSLALARRLVRRPDILVLVETPLATVAARRPGQPAARLRFEMERFRHLSAAQPPEVTVVRVAGDDDHLAGGAQEVVTVVTDGLRYRLAAGRHRDSRHR